jgi:hypothetical protein
MTTCCRKLSARLRSREPDSIYDSRWSTRGQNGGEARCIALLEDRIRIETGGMDGSLSLVDLRITECFLRR